MTLREETKTRIRGSAVRSLLTHGCESRAEAQKIKQIDETTETKVLRKITQKSLRDKIISSVIREHCEFQPVIRWINNTRIK
jgi:hypothetical protein